MAITLKTQKSVVVDALRAARNADDEISRLKENSWEHAQSKLVAALDSPNWKHGPAELVATFPHHALAKTVSGSVVQVEWCVTPEQGVTLGRAVIHEMSTPVSDLGRELMETAKSAIDCIIDEDFDSAEPMISSIADALDTGGDLQRRVQNEITVRSLKRDAWWHQVVGIREGIEDLIPQPVLETDEDLIKTVNDLLRFLKEAAGDAAKVIKLLDESDKSRDLISLADDIAEDIQRAIGALAHANLSNHEEALQLYEAVMAATPRLLNGIAFLSELGQEANSEAQEG